MNIPGWSEDMMKSWTEAQQNYWNNLMGVSGNTASVPNWAEGMEKWWSMVTPQMPVQANELMSRVFEMGKVYTRLAEDAVAATSGSENKNVLEGWMTSMEQGFKDWSVQNGTDFSNIGTGSHVVEGWQQVMDSMGMGAFKAMPDMASNAEAWQEQVQKMLGLSGPGGTIPQDSQAKLAELTATYQKAMQDYMGAFSGQGVDSVQALRERMEQLSKDGASITSLRELYDLWVDVSEEVYQKFAMSDRYQKVYGEMVNSFVALKGGIDTVRETQLQALRILTTTDLDELLKSQHEAARENEDLNDQVDELKERVNSLEDTKSKTGRKAAEKVTPKKPVAKKPAATKAADSAAKPAKQPAKKAPVTKPEVAAVKPEVAVAKTAPKPKATPKPKTAAAEPEATVAKTSPKPKTATKPKTAAKTAPKVVTAKPVAAPKSTAAAEETTKAKNAQIKSSNKPDDLTKIKGLGPKMQEKLIDAGIQTFDQLAALSDDQAQVLDKQLDARGRLVRENWVTQASDISGGKLA
ncbi:MAG: Unknown protein [uncultured Thiotrichaceae bacterium]|uniref:Poly(3-hydroxyalkanoate) polymerase subunit PhaE n=1 Tax=uncultured Thiotrichaceae bacterium TaxID=298394 RepID=A0A6S6TP78_9GAMM|nr:MAG: Unknown protein [uncultured Thiotrichaceae bacterium]